MFKAACLLVLGLTIFLSPSAQTAAAGRPHLVFTKRIDSKRSTDLFTYTVQKGEHLYSILRSFHIPEQKLGQWVRKVNELNPHIHDPDILYPGNQLSLPRSLKSHPDEKSARTEDRQAPDPTQSIPHTVPASVSASSLFSERIQPSSASQIKTSAQAMKTKHRASASSAVLKNKEQVIHQLRGLGFRFSRQGEVIYPLGQGKWIRINLNQMPLASSPWKSRILFAPQALLDAPQAKALSQAGLLVCPVPSDWSPRHVFAALDRSCRPNFMAWSPGNPLILTLPQGHRVEIKAPTIFTLKKDKKQKIAVFAQPDICSGCIPGLLVGYLQQQRIKILCSNPDSGFSAWKDQNVPSGQNLYTPSLSWPEFKDYVELSGHELTAPISPVNALQSLSEQGLLQRYPLHLSWSTPSGLNIILRLSLLGHRNTSGTKYFLSADQTDPYLVALLNLMGYTTYELRF